MANGLTPPVLNKHPFGLLDFFGIKNGGRDPQQLAEILAPVIDLDRLYKVNAEEYFLGGAAGAVADSWHTTTPLLAVVPAQEIWHVHHIDYDWQLVAAEAVAYWPGVRVPEGTFLSSGMTFHNGSGGVFTGAMPANGRIKWGTDWQGFGRYFKPGSQFGAYVQSVTGNPLMQIQLRFTRYRF